MAARDSAIRGILPHRGADAKRIDNARGPVHNARMKMALSFLSMAILAVVIWRILRHQETSDASFERRLKADDRRARANREAAARDNRSGPPPAPPA